MTDCWLVRECGVKLGWSGCDGDVDVDGDGDVDGEVHEFLGETRWSFEVPASNWGRVKLPCTKTTLKGCYRSGSPLKSNIELTLAGLVGLPKHPGAPMISKVCLCFIHICSGDYRSRINLN